RNFRKPPPTPENRFCRSCVSELLNCPVAAGACIKGVISSVRRGVSVRDGRCRDDRGHRRRRNKAVAEGSLKRKARFFGHRLNSSFTALLMLRLIRLASFFFFRRKAGQKN